MNKRLKKKYKKKALNISKLAVLGRGLLSGYSCPTCGQKRVKQPFCPTCNQRLIYDESQINDWESLDAYYKYIKKK